MSVKVTQLRSDLYRMIDNVLASGTPLAVERNGKTLLISPAPASSKLDALIARPGVIVGDPADLIHRDWSTEWTP